MPQNVLRAIWLLAYSLVPGRRDRKTQERFTPGDVILNRYKILSELGQGGMGVVYKCFDEVAGIEIALKALPPELSHNTLEMEDIRENFQLISKLVHQNIAISRNLERDNLTGDYYLILEYVNGSDLRHWLKQQRRTENLTLENVLPLLRQIAAALDYAHSEKIIHRDIKPGNIMLTNDGKIKILDFGLAAQIHTSMSRVSLAYHGTSGTGPYMAPEQWRGRAQNAASDQYALAVMAYEMLAGNLPFENPDAAILREAVLNENPDPLSGVPSYVQTAISRAMSKDPALRFDSCSDFVAALEGKNGTSARKNVLSGKGKILSFAAILFLLAAGCGAWWLNRSHAKPELPLPQSSHVPLNTPAIETPVDSVKKDVSESEREENKAITVEEKRLSEERRILEAERRKLEQERLRLAEEKRLAEERRKLEQERLRLAEEKRRAEELRKQEQERLRLAEEKHRAEELRKQEQKRQAEAEKKRQQANRQRNLVQTKKQVLLTDEMKKAQNINTHLSAIASIQSLYAEGKLTAFETYMRIQKEAAAILQIQPDHQEAKEYMVDSHIQRGKMLINLFEKAALPMSKLKDVEAHISAVQQLSPGNIKAGELQQRYDATVSAYLERQKRAKQELEKQKQLKYQKQIADIRKRAEEYYAQKSYRTAIAEYNKIPQNELKWFDNQFIGKSYYFLNDLKNAERYLLKAHNMGAKDPDCIFARLYMKMKDYTKCIYVLRTQVEQENTLAMLYLSVIYLQGWGGYTNQKKGKELLIKAADKGLPSAQYNLGCCYAKLKGMNFDIFEYSLQKAKYYLTLAKQNGISKADEILKSLGE